MLKYERKLDFIPPEDKTYNPQNDEALYKLAEKFFNKSTKEIRQKFKNPEAKSLLILERRDNEIYAIVTSVK